MSPSQTNNEPPKGLCTLAQRGRYALVWGRDGGFRGVDCGALGSRFLEV